jgi:hypothetical protein
LDLLLSALDTKPQFQGIQPVFRLAVVASHRTHRGAQLPNTKVPIVKICLSLIHDLSRCLLLLMHRADAKKVAALHQRRSALPMLRFVEFAGGGFPDCLGLSPSRRR